jgi:hypothetical protein
MGCNFETGKEDIPEIPTYSTALLAHRFNPLERSGNRMYHFLMVKLMQFAYICWTIEK